MVKCNGPLKIVYHQHCNVVTLVAQPPQNFNFKDEFIEFMWKLK